MCVTWFLRINRKKGKDYTTVTAQQVAEWIGEKFGADVQPKAAQNALRFLTVHGRLIRMDHKVFGWKKIYRYSLPHKDTEVPVVFLDRDADVHEQGPSHGPDGPPFINPTNKNKINPIKESREVHAPQCVEPSPSSTKPRHPVIRRPSDDSKATVDMDTHQSPTKASGDAPRTTQEPSKSGVIGDVQSVESHRLLSEIERATLDDLGAPDLKTNPTAYLNWVIDRRERQT
jgi:hypothetical protein